MLMSNRKTVAFPPQKSMVMPRTISQGVNGHFTTFFSFSSLLPANLLLFAQQSLLNGFRTVLLADKMEPQIITTRVYF